MTELAVERVLKLLLKKKNNNYCSSFWDELFVALGSRDGATFYQWHKKANPVKC